MIVSNLQHSARIEPLHPLFKQLFDYVKSHDLLHTPCGRIELDGNNLFINNVNPTCVKASEQVLEVHRNYIDIHILLEGKERIGWKAIEDVNQLKQAYQEEVAHSIQMYPPPLLIYFPDNLLSYIRKIHMHL